MQKYHLIMEKFWLVTAMISTPFAAYIIKTHGWSEGAPYLFAPAVAILMYRMRKNYRKRQENS